MKPGDCKHFTGLQHKVCAAGVSYASMRDASEPGPAQWPCLNIPGNRKAKTVCPRFEAQTQEAWAKERAELDTALQAALSGNCPTCGAICERKESERTLVLSCPTHGFVMRGCKRVGEP